MINTELHNALVEKEIQNKLIQSDKVNQKAKTELMIEKLKSILLVVGVIFIILLLLIFLYWIFPNKQVHNNSSIVQIEKIFKQYNKESSCCEKEKDQQIKSKNLLLESNDNRSNKKNNISRKPKDGVDYVKHDNHIYKRTWKDGELLEDKKLEESIKESREKSNENIPQIATPK